MSKTFSDLGIHEHLLQSLTALQISVPTDIQQKAIPVLLNQKEDVVALAKTGTGKTAAFGLPLLQLIDIKSIDIQAVILAPTRELGQQIYHNLVSFASHSPEISIAAICGGRSEEHTSELQSRENLVCRLLLEKKNKNKK